MDSRSGSQTIAHRDTGLLRSPDSAPTLVNSGALTSHNQSPNSSDDDLASLPVGAAVAKIERASSDQRLEWLPSLTPEQWVGLSDYMFWRGEELVPTAVAEWMELLAQLGPDQLTARVKQLDHEFLLHFLGGFLDIQEGEQLEESDLDPTRHNSEGLIRVPGTELFYRVLTSDPRLKRAIELVVDSVLSEDAEFGLSLLSMAAMQPPNESRAMALQFRRARLEEDGFLTLEEARAIFLPDDPRRLAERWNQDLTLDGAIARPDDDFLQALVNRVSDRFEDSVLDGFVQSVVHLSNGAAVLAQIEASDHRGLNVLAQRVSSLVGFGIESLSGGDIDRACEILAQEHPRDIFRYSLGQIQSVQKQVVNAIADTCLPGADRYQKWFYEAKFGQMLWHVDAEWNEVLGARRCAQMSGLFNRFPMLCQRDGERWYFQSIGSMAAFQELQAQARQLIWDLNLLDDELEPLDLLASRYTVGKVSTGQTRNDHLLGILDLDREGLHLRLTELERQSEIPSRSETIDEVRELIEECLKTSDREQRADRIRQLLQP